MKFIRVSVYAVWLVVVMRMSFFASPSFLSVSLSPFPFLVKIVYIMSFRLSTLSLYKSLKQRASLSLFFSPSLSLLPLGVEASGK